MHSIVDEVYLYFETSVFKTGDYSASQYGIARNEMPCFIFSYFTVAFFSHYRKIFVTECRILQDKTDLFPYCCRLLSTAQSRNIFTKNVQVW